MFFLVPRSDAVASACPCHATPLRGNVCVFCHHQIEVRHELRKRFPRRPWLDVVSKADLPRLELEKAEVALPEGYLDVSTEDGTGVEELKDR